MTISLPRLAACLGLSLSTLSAAPMLLYLGTYTRATSRGIYSAQFDPATGAFSTPRLAAEAQNPTFLVLDSSHRHLYTCGELRLDPPVQPARGGVSAYQVEAATGTLKFINQEPTGAGSTTHLVVDGSNRMVITVNYDAGYVAAVPIRADGGVGERSAYFNENGRAEPGPNRSRQTKSYAHSVTVSPDGLRAYVCDLGLDRVFIYRLEPATAGLVINDPPAAVAPPGSGPRHSKFSADGRFFYVADEVDSSLSVYSHDAKSGGLARLQHISTLPAGTDGSNNTVAEVRIHPNGRFVYVSNRGHESIAVFARDPAQGTVRLVEIISCGGKHPRAFTLSPDGNWLLCANRDTDNVVSFRVDPASGRLSPSGHEATVSMPTCVLFCD